MTKTQARNEIMKIVKFELPKVKTKQNKRGFIVKATKKDAELSRSLSLRIAELMSVVEA